MEAGIYGWRARMGYAGVTPLSTTPYEFWKMAPDGVALVTTGLHVQRDFSDPLDVVLGEMGAALGALDKFGLDAVTLGASPLLWRCSDAELRQLRDAAAAATTAPVVFASDAVCAAMAHLGARRVGIVSPFGETVNASLTGYLASREFGVEGVAAYGEAQDKAPFDTVRNLGLDFLRDHPATDVLYVCGDQWVIAPHLQALERETGVPVVCDTSAMLWHLMDRLRISARPADYGRLLSQH